LQRKGTSVTATESEIEQAFTTHAHDLGCKHWKWVSPGRPGVPDRILVVPAGMRFSMKPAIRFIEWKSESGRLRKAQARRIKELRDAGCIVHVLRGLEEGKILLKGLIQC